MDFVVKIKDPLLVPILLDPLWYWCVKPSVKRDNAARDIQETAEEEARENPERRKDEGHRPSGRFLLCQKTCAQTY